MRLVSLLTTVLAFVVGAALGYTAAAHHLYPGTELLYSAPEQPEAAAQAETVPPTPRLPPEGMVIAPPAITDEPAIPVPLRPAAAIE